MPEELPSGETGDIVPVALPAIGVAMLPNAVAGIIAEDDIVAVDDAVVAVLPAMDVATVLGTVDGVGTDGAAMEGGGRVGTAGGGGAGTVVPGNVDMNDVPGCADSVSNGAVVLFVVGTEEVAGATAIVGAADIDGVVPIVPPVADMEVTGTAEVAGVICPDGVAQVTTVPGVVGSEASGTAASVVSATPGWVAAENGPGPLSGEDRTVPGVDARPMAVLPMVDTCARPALQPASRIAVVNNKGRIAIPPSRPI